MVQIVEITEDLLPNVPHLIELLYELYGAKTIGLFAVLVDGKLGFIGRDGANCVYIHDKGYNRFTLNEKEVAIYNSIIDSKYLSSNRKIILTHYLKIMLDKVKNKR